MLRYAVGCNPLQETYPVMRLRCSALMAMAFTLHPCVAKDGPYIAEHGTQSSFWMLKTIYGQWIAHPWHINEIRNFGDI